MIHITVSMYHYFAASTPAALGLILAERRRHRNLSHADLGRICGAAAGDIRRLEEGRWVPSPSQAWALADVLGLEPEAFAAWTIRQLLFHPELLAQHVLSAAA
jgi:transcriptional regulator with XRE-family HTH domain